MTIAISLNGAIRRWAAQLAAGLADIWRAQQFARAGDAVRHARIGLRA